VRRSLENLAYEIFGQIEIIPSDREQWADIARSDGEKEIEQRAVFEEFRREARVGSEQQRVLAADDPRIEMRNRHRRRTDRGLAVDLGVMAFVQLGIVAAQPDAAHGKSAVSFSLGDLGFLQQPQRAAAGAEKDEFRSR